MSKSHTSCSCIQEKPQETGPLTVDYDLKNIVKFVYFLPCLFSQGELLQFENVCGSYFCFTPVFHYRCKEVPVLDDR